MQRPQASSSLEEGLILSTPPKATGPAPASLRRHIYTQPFSILGEAQAKAQQEGRALRPQPPTPPKARGESPSRNTTVSDVPRTKKRAPGKPLMKQLTAREMALTLKPTAIVKAKTRLTLTPRSGQRRPRPPSTHPVFKASTPPARRQSSDWRNADVQQEPNSLLARS